MRLFLFLLMACYTVYAPSAVATDSDNTEFPSGLWLTKKMDTAVRIEACGNLLCGYISWLRPDVAQMTPDGMPLCNHKVLWGFEKDTAHPDLWKGGTILRANEGKTYSGRLRFRGPDEIELRGYLGVPLVGKTYTLTRARESQYPQCSS